MKKKIILGFLVFIIIIFFLNFNFLVGNYYFLTANKNYKNSNFSDAFKKYNNSSNYLSGDIIDYNIGNTFYKLGYNQTSTGKKIEYYTKSLEKYGNLIVKNKDNLGNNEDLVFNYQFVKQKLDELIKKKEDKNQDQKNNKQDENKDEKKNEGNNDKNENKKTEDNKKDYNEKQKDKNKSGNEKSDLDNKKINPEDIKISQDELKQIDEYFKGLKNDEKNYRQYYNTLDINNASKYFLPPVINVDEKDW